MPRPSEVELQPVHFASLVVVVVVVLPSLALFMQIDCIDRPKADEHASSGPGQRAANDLQGVLMNRWMLLRNSAPIARARLTAAPARAGTSAAAPGAPCDRPPERCQDGEQRRVDWAPIKGGQLPADSNGLDG